jgi:hypothetical protein
MTQELLPNAPISQHQIHEIFGFFFSGMIMGMPNPCFLRISRFPSIRNFKVMPNANCGWPIAVEYREY